MRFKTTNLAIDQPIKDEEHVFVLPSFPVSITEAEMRNLEGSKTTDSTHAWSSPSKSQSCFTEALGL